MVSGSVLSPKSELERPQGPLGPLRQNLPFLQSKAQRAAFASPGGFPRPGQGGQRLARDLTSSPGAGPGHRGLRRPNPHTCKMGFRAKGPNCDFSKAPPQLLGFRGRPYEDLFRPHSAGPSPSLCPGSCGKLACLGARAWERPRVQESARHPLPRHRLGPCAPPTGRPPPTGRVQRRVCPDCPACGHLPSWPE